MIDPKCSTGYHLEYLWEDLHEDSSATWVHASLLGQEKPVIRAKVALKLEAILDLQQDRAANLCVSSLIELA